MRQLSRLTRFVFLIVFTALLSSSCMTGSYTTSSSCKGGGGWYTKNKNLGPKNKPVNYTKTVRLVKK